MPELPSGFWGGWILVVTLVSLAAVLWLSYSVYFSADAQHSGESDEEPVWDNDLREGSNAPPLWWFWFLLGATVFSLVYLMLYPGLGFYSGVLNWDQGSRLASSYGNFTAEFEQPREAIAAMPLAEIQGDATLMATADRVFQRECSACHGPEARGQAAMFPNLVDVDWQWGGSAQAIEQSIRQGRNAMMPPWEAALTDAQTGPLVEFVRQLDTPAAATHPGKATYDQFCIACHGPDATGNALLGAPNLSDSTWLYGGTAEAVRISILQGRRGVMPAFDRRLDEAQIRLLVALLAR